MTIAGSLDDPASIATLCGFGTAHQMRTHFTRINHVTARVYKRTFRSRAAA